MPSAAATPCTSWRDEERRGGAAYLRPMVLIQSEPRRAGVETLDFERVRDELITNQRHSRRGNRRRHRRGKGAGADRRRLQAGHCRPGLPGEIRHHPEGAGRGLGLPVCLHSGEHGLAAFGHGGGAVARARAAPAAGASHRQAKALNQSYAFVVSRNFAETASALRDRLVAGCRLRAARGG